MSIDKFESTDFHYQCPKTGFPTLHCDRQQAAKPPCKSWSWAHPRPKAQGLQSAQERVTEFRGAWARARLFGALGVVAKNHNQSGGLLTHYLGLHTYSYHGFTFKLSPSGPKASQALCERLCRLPWGSQGQTQCQQLLEHVLRFKVGFFPSCDYLELSFKAFKSGLPVWYLLGTSTQDFYCSFNSSKIGAKLSPEERFTVGPELGRWPTPSFWLGPIWPLHCPPPSRWKPHPRRGFRYIHISPFV